MTVPQLHSAFEGRQLTAGTHSARPCARLAAAPQAIFGNKQKQPSLTKVRSWRLLDLFALCALNGVELRRGLASLLARLCGRRCLRSRVAGVFPCTLPFETAALVGVGGLPYCLLGEYTSHTLFGPTYGGGTCSGLGAISGLGSGCYNVLYVSAARKENTRQQYLRSQFTS